MSVTVKYVSTRLGHPSAICLQVLPLQNLLRSCWDSAKFLKSSSDSGKPFLIEEDSKMHVLRLERLMKSDFDWSVIALVSLVSAEADLVGKWAEGCPCEEHQYVSGTSKKRSGQLVQVAAPNADASSCAFKACRAPELAQGFGIKIQHRLMLSHKEEFMEFVSMAPPDKQPELAGAWTTATSKLFGIYG